MPPSTEIGLRPVLGMVLRGSLLHVGGIATQSWLRTMLVDTGRLGADDFNRCFAVSRLTPGTNLLAFHAALGYVVARWRGAISALGIGTFAPAGVALLLAFTYVRYARVSGVDRFMAGAQAGAVAVLFWTAAGLLVATARKRLQAGSLLATATAAAVWSGLPPVVILLMAAAAGAWLLGGEA